MKNKLLVVLFLTTTTIATGMMPGRTTQNFIKRIEGSHQNWGPLVTYYSRKHAMRVTYYPYLKQYQGAFYEWGFENPSAIKDVENVYKFLELQWLQQQKLITSKHIQ